jgi:hypothetical protein
MATQINETSAVFRRPAVRNASIAFGVSAVFCVIAGLLIAAFLQSWAVSAFLFAGLCSAGALAYVKYGEIHAFMFGRSDLNWSNASPDLQKQDVNLAVDEIARILKTKSDERAELYLTYVLAEDLALRRIQQEHAAPLMRHVTLNRVTFDAVISAPGILTCVEVAFLVQPLFSQDRIDAVLKKAARVAASGLRQNVRLLIVLVTQISQQDAAHLQYSLAKDRFAETPVDIDIRFLDFESLQKTFLTD